MRGGGERGEGKGGEGRGGEGRGGQYNCDQVVQTSSAVEQQDVQS